MSVRLVYQDVAVGAEDNASISTSPAQSFSTPGALPKGVECAPFATLERNSWLLDGSRIWRKKEPAGFWSSELSGRDGIFLDKPAITIKFTRLYTSIGVSLIFDTATGDYCSDITIIWYRDSAVLSRMNFHPDGPVYFCRNTVERYNKIVIEINAASLPRRYAKISRILFGLTRTFLRDELRNVKITEEISLISTDLAVNKMNVSLDSHSDIEFIFQLLQPIFAYDGETLIGAFYIEESNRRGKNLYDLSCNDAVGVLDYETVPAVMYEKKPLREALEEILDGKFELELAPELESETLTGYVPEGTRRDALRHIAFASRCVADTSGTYAVRFFRVQSSAPEVIPPARIYTGGSVNTTALVTAVRVTAHSYSKSGTGNSVEAGGVTYYDTQTVTTLNNPDIISSDKPNVVEITDATLVNPSNVAEVAQAVYDHYVRRSTHHLKVVMSGEQPGDCVTTATPWGTQITGSIIAMNITLSGIAAADCEVVGA